MNRTQEFETLDEFEKEHYFPPEKDWPEWEFQYRSTCRWALNEIRTAMAKREKDPILDILGDFYANMDVAATESSDLGQSIKPWKFPPPELVFSVAREMANEVAGLYL